MFSMSPVVYFWFVVLVAAVAVELGTMGLTSVWFAVGALLSGLIALAGGPFWLQEVVFFGASILLLLFVRPVASKYFNKSRKKTNVESIVGMKAVVTEEVNNFKATGQALVDGKEWMTRSADDTQIIPEGAVVTITAISGVKLIVATDDK